ENPCEMRLYPCKSGADCIRRAKKRSRQFVCFGRLLKSFLQNNLQTKIQFKTLLAMCSNRAKLRGPHSAAELKLKRRVEQNVQSNPLGVVAGVALALQRIMLLERATQVVRRKDDSVSIADF